MIATIATVCLAVSAAAEPLRTPLLRNFYSTGSSCSLSNYQCVDGNSFCEDGNVMTCASGTVCGTPERPDWTPCIPPGPSPTPTPPHPGCSMDGNTCGRMGHPMCCLRKLSNNLLGLASHEAQRKLNGYTQSLGKPCDLVSYCKSGLKCTNDVFNTGKCVKGENWVEKAGEGIENGAKDLVVGLAGSRQLRKLATQNSHEAQRKLNGYTQSLGEPCDMVSHCKKGLKCDSLDIDFTGKCVEG